MPGGEGVAYSPTSPVTRATMPAKGAASTVRSSPARVTSICAWARFTSAASASQLAWRARALARLSSTRCGLTKPCAASVSSRAASRRAFSARMQASRRRSSLVVSWRWASSRCAARSRFHSSSSGWPPFTRSPSFTNSFTICPPAAGASLARRQAVTVPARVLTTVASTGPRASVATSTWSGLGRVACQPA